MISRVKGIKASAGGHEIGVQPGSPSPLLYRFTQSTAPSKLPNGTGKKCGKSRSRYRDDFSGIRLRIDAVVFLCVATCA